jgi:surface-anchored protein
MGQLRTNNEEDLVVNLTAKWARRGRRPGAARARRSTPLRVELLETRNVLSLLLTPNPVVDVSQNPGNEWQGSLAVDPTNPTRQFAVSNQDSGGLFAACSADGGGTWTPSDLSNIPDAWRDPRAAFDAFGNLFLAYLAPDNSVAVAWSTDDGQTFASSATVDTGASTPALATGPGGSVAAGSVWVTYTTAAGQVAAGAPVTALGGVGAFHAPQLAPGSAGGAFGSVAIGPSGQVLVSYQSPADGTEPSAIFANTDPDGLGPAGFNAAVTVTTTNVGAGHALPAQPNAGIDAGAALAWDHGDSRFSGRAYLVYTNASAPGGTDTSIFLRYSVNNGQTWSSPVALSSDRSGHNSKFNPAIAIDQHTGQIAVAWLDARRDLGDFGAGDTDGVPNDDVQVFGTVSYSGGRTFVRDTVLSDPTGASSAALAGNPGDFGRSLGLDFVNGAFYPLWADNSAALTANPDGPHFDLAATRVDVAPNVLDRQHVDVTFDYIGGAWRLGVQDKDPGGRRYTPDEVILYASPSTQNTQPDDPRFDFIGAGRGNPYWLMPQNQDQLQLYLGINSESTPFGTFATYFESDPRINQTGEWIKFSLIDVRGPGYFSVWQTGGVGNVNLWMASSDGIDSSDALFSLSDGHLHYNWGFTAPGLYQIDFQASAYLGPGMTNPTLSAVETYTYIVEDYDYGTSPAPRAGAAGAGPATPPPPPRGGGGAGGGGGDGRAAALALGQALPGLPALSLPPPVSAAPGVVRPPPALAGVGPSFAATAGQGRWLSLPGRRAGTPVPRADGGATWELRGNFLEEEALATLS